MRSTSERRPIRRRRGPRLRTALHDVHGAHGGNLGASFVYTAAMQAADLGSAQAKVYLAIYQISQIVGRGFGIGVIGVMQLTATVRSSP